MVRDDLGMILVCFWYHFGIILTPFCDHSGIIFVIILKSLWDHSGPIMDHFQFVS